MRDFLRKKRHTDTAEPDTAPDTASIRTPAETTAPERKHRQWYLRFARQQLLGWSPIITGNLVIAYLFATAVLCFALGLPILLASTSLPVYAVRYDNASPFSSPNSLQKQQLLESYRGEGAPVSVVMTVRKRMTQPVYLSFELGSFYQNHKRYVRSRKDAQLHKNDNASSVCNPQGFLVNNQLDPGLPFDGDILPCGLIAWSQFNDTFAARIASPGQTPQNLPIDEDLVAWPYDRDHFYSARAPHNWNDNATLAGGVAHQKGGNTSSLPLRDNQHFMVWMRPHAQPTARKLYGIIHQDIPAGSQVTFTVQNRYNTYGFSGSKEVVLGNESWVGGKNTFLGIAYLTVAGLALVTGIVFFVFYSLGLATRRKFADYSYLSWNRH